MTPSTRNFGSNWPCWSENADFQSIFARSASAVTPSEKVQLTLIGSRLTNEPKMTSYVVPMPSPQRDGSKTQNSRFPSKIALHLKKMIICYKVSFCEYCQWQRCKAFTGLSIGARMVGGRRSLEGEFSCKSEPPVSARTNASHADMRKRQNTTYILFASQRLQCSVKFITTPIDYKPSRGFDAF